MILFHLIYNLDKASPYTVGRIQAGLSKIAKDLFCEVNNKSYLYSTLSKVEIEKIFRAQRITSYSIKEYEVSNTDINSDEIKTLIENLKTKT